jgi:anti-sigma regulatory factor (Ser/Thr protein kinase)
MNNPSGSAAPDRRTSRDAARSALSLRVSLTSHEQIAGLRTSLRGILVSSDEPSREAVVLAASEAVANALTACEGRPDCRAEAVATVMSGYVCLEVRDNAGGMNGACFDLTHGAGPDDEHGRGLQLMNDLMESFELLERADGTMVRMTRRIPRTGEPDA